MRTRHILSAALSAALVLGALPFPSARAAEAVDLDEAVAALTTLGIVAGYSDGLYHGEDSLTRGQFCKLAVLTEGHGDQVAVSAYRSLFSDVPAANWAAPYVNLAHEEGLVSGRGDGSFGVDDPVTLGEAVTVVLRLLGYTDEDVGPFWPEDHISKAAKLELLDGIGTDANAALTRGQAAQLLYAALLGDNKEGEVQALSLASKSVEQVILLDRDAEAPTGTLHTAQVYADGAIAYYEQSAVLADSFVGRRGTLLLNKSGKVMGFLPSDGRSVSFKVDEAEADALTDTSGNSYALASKLALVDTSDDNALSTYGGMWYDLDSRDVTLYYDESGDPALLAVGEVQAYGGAALTGYCDAVSPNAAAPDTITLLGHVFDVADGATGLGDLAVGGKLTLTLNGAGEVTAVTPASKKSVTVVATLNSAASGALTHISGLALSAAVSNATEAAKLEGCLVRVTSTAVGKCSVSALSGGTLSGTLDLSADKLGSVALADDVRIFDQVSGAPAVEIEKEDILAATVASSKIAYAGTNEAGRVNLIVLNNVTGDGYSYGIYRTSSVTTGEGTTDESSYRTVALENGAGTTDYAASVQTVRDGAFGGLAMTPAGKVVGFTGLTEVQSVSRSAFDGTDAVVVSEVRVPVADGVQVYNSANKTWTGLDEAKAYSDKLTVWYSGTLGVDAKVRVVVVG